MRSGVTGRLITIAFVLALAAMFFVPNIATISWWPTKDRIRYGLDIQGGLYLVMGVDTASVLRESTDRLAETHEHRKREKYKCGQCSAREKSA
jgi:preprotein translocase subunit SecD